MGLSTSLNSWTWRWRVRSVKCSGCRAATTCAGPNWTC